LTLLEDGKPFFYVLDSFDALDAIQDDAKVEEHRKARAKGVKPPGSYGMAKPKKASEILRGVCGKLKKSSSCLLIISQTRDNIDPMSFEKKKRSGGNALKFYATHEIWAAVGKALKKNINDVPRTIGHEVHVKITKNKITGKKRTITLMVYNDYGVDDIGSCIDFLVKEKYWKGGGAAKIDTKGDLDVDDCLRATLIKRIEEGGLEADLRKATANAWHDIEQKLKLGRKPRYGS
jgi:RecA/RadA recombinase